MTPEKFSRLVERLEAAARSNPARYQRHVILLAFAGYAYLGAVLVLLAGLFVAALWSIVWMKVLGAKLAFAIGVFIWLVLKALWIRFPAPEGIEVRRGEAPALF